VTTAEISQKAPQKDSATSSTGRSIFEDPAISEAGKNDPFVRFVQRNWRSLILLLVALGVAMVGYNVFTKTALEKRARATTLLADIQESYRSLSEQQERLRKLGDDRDAAKDDAASKSATEAYDIANKELGEAREKLVLMINSLDSPPPFDSYATLYRGLLAARFGELAKLEEELKRAPSWEAIDDAKSSRRFIAETVNLGLLRGLSQSEQHKASVRERLKDLAERGEYLAVDALAVLVAQTVGREERLKLSELIDATRQRFPSRSKELNELKEGL
jgi:hypothetical protein